MPSIGLNQWTGYKANRDEIVGKIEHEKYQAI